MKYIINKTSIANADVGEKSKRLFEMQKLNIKVPDFMCLSSQCFTDHILPFKPVISKLISDIDYNNMQNIIEISSQIQTLIMEKDFSEMLIDEINSNIKPFIAQHGNISVRSSANCEDGEKTSFAGQFESFLFVEFSDIFTSIKKVWASTFSPNSLKYFHNNHTNTENVAMGVVFQEMITPDFSGVSFSSNPSGILSEMLVVIGEGVGENIVLDKVPTCTYYYSKIDKTYYFEKQEGAYICQQSMLYSIIEATSLIQEFYNQEVDVEFAVKNNVLYILQSRPITTLNLANSIILDNSNIVESYPGVTSPLTYSFIKSAYTNIFKNVCSKNIANDRIIDLHGDVFDNMIDCVNGRVYYCISNWYYLLRFLPFSKKIIPVWQDMLGVDNKDYTPGNTYDFSLFDKAKILKNSLSSLIKVEKNMDKLDFEFKEIECYFKENYSENMSNQDIKKIYDILFTKVLNNWDVTLVNDLYAFLFTGLLKKRMTHQKLENAQFNDYISGISKIESLKPILTLLNLSKEISCNNEFLMVLNSLKSDKEFYEIKNTISSENLVLYNKIIRYINIYGDRCICELKLETKTYREYPIELIGKILEYTSDVSKLNSTIENISNVSGNKTSVSKITKYISTKAQKGIENREKSRLNRTRIYGIVRRLFLHTGTNMVSCGLLECREDIFYLTVDEVFDESNYHEISKKIASRKPQFDMFNNLPIYTRLVFDKKPFDKHHKNINFDNVSFSQNGLSGVGCSNGEIEATVVVIEDATQNVDVKNKIIVTKMTDPGWVFLLSMASGIITEKGSILSHTAIISREIKIPAVVGVDNITSILKTGDKVKMNGNTGIIEVI